MNDPFREQPEQLERCAYCHDQCMSATPEVIATGSQAHVVSRVAAVARLLEAGRVRWSASSGAPLFYGLNDGWQQEYCIFSGEGQRIEPYLRRFRHHAVTRGVAPVAVADALSAARATGNVFGLERSRQTTTRLTGGGVAFVHDAATRALTPHVVSAAHAVLERAEGPVIDLAVESGGMIELDLGEEELARDAAAAVATVVAASGATLLVTTDAVLAYAMRLAYPFLGVDLAIPVLHFAEYLVDHPPKTTAGRPTSVVFHDPAWLSRGLGVIDAPRTVIRRVGGVQLLEAASSGRLAGSDGPLWGYPDSTVAAAIAADRMEELRTTGAELIVTASPYSEANLSAASGGDIEVVDLSQFLASRLDVDGSCT